MIPLNPITILMCAVQSVVASPSETYVTGKAGIVSKVFPDRNSAPIIRKLVLGSVLSKAEGAVGDRPYRLSHA